MHSAMMSKPSGDSFSLGDFLRRSSVTYAGQKGYRRKAVFSYDCHFVENSVSDSNSFRLGNLFEALLCCTRRPERLQRLSRAAL